MMASFPKEQSEDPKKQSFWMVRIIFMIKSKKRNPKQCSCVFVNVQLGPVILTHHRHLSSSQPGNYVRTVHRTEQSFQACNDIVACFVERAKVEKQYAQQLSQWSSKWKSVVDSRKYGRLHDGGSLCGLETENMHSQAFLTTSALIKLK